MYQLPAPLWNEIADSQHLYHDFFREVMALPHDGLDEALQEKEAELQSMGAPDEVIVSFMYLSPLLAEHEAISRYISSTGRLDLRSALPEVLTPAEAVTLAVQERFLGEREQAILLGLLQGLLAFGPQAE